MRVRDYGLNNISLYIYIYISFNNKNKKEQFEINSILQKETSKQLKHIKNINIYKNNVVEW